MKKTLVLITLLSISVAAHGQRKWTLRECIDHAVENNIELKQQKISVENSEIELNTSRNSRFPDVSASASQSFGFGRSPSMGSGVYENSSSSSTGYSVSAGMDVFQGGRINNQIKSSELDLLAAVEGLNKAREDLTVNVASAYLEVLFKKEMLALAVQQQSLTQRQLKRTEIMVGEQSVPMSQLYDIRAKVADDELSVVNAGNDLAMSMLALAQLLNIRDTDGFDITDPEDDGIAGIIPDIRKPEEIYRTALEIKPRVKEAEYRLDNSRAGIRIAQASRWPSVSLGLSHNNGFNHSLESTVSNPSIKTQLQNNRRESIGLSVNLPIFNRMQTRNQIRAARLNAQSRELELEKVKSELFKEIQQAYQSAVAARSKYASTEKAREASEEAFRHAVEKYNESMSNVYELSEAQNKFVSSRSEQLQAKYELLFKTKILNYYQGVDIDL